MGTLVGDNRKLHVFFKCRKSWILSGNPIKKKRCKMCSSYLKFWKWVPQDYMHTSEHIRQYQSEQKSFYYHLHGRTQDCGFGRVSVHSERYTWSRDCCSSSTQKPVAISSTSWEFQLTECSQNQTTAQFHCEFKTWKTPIETSDSHKQLFRVGAWLSNCKDHSKESICPSRWKSCIG